MLGQIFVVCPRSQTLQYSILAGSETSDLKSGYIRAQEEPLNRDQLMQYAIRAVKPGADTKRSSIGSLGIPVAKLES